MVFFRSDTGKEPVKEWLRGLAPEDRKIIGEDVKTAEFGWPIGMPTVKSLGKDLWEIRSRISDKREARILFAVTKGHMILLHGFIKKTQKTPSGDMEMAIKRWKKCKDGSV